MNSKVNTRISGQLKHVVFVQTISRVFMARFSHFRKITAKWHGVSGLVSYVIIQPMLFKCFVHLKNIFFEIILK